MKKTNALRLLDQAKISYECVSYQYDPQDLNVEKIAADNDLQVQAVFKTLVAKGPETGPIVAVIAGDQVLDLKALARASGNKKVKLFPIPDLEPTTGYIRGGCSPLGMKKPFPVFIDQAAEALGSIYVNAGVRGVLVKVPTDDLLRISRGQLVEIAQPKPES